MKKLFLLSITTLLIAFSFVEVKAEELIESEKTLIQDASESDDISMEDNEPASMTSGGHTEVRTNYWYAYVDRFRFIEYLTPTWAHTSQYHWGKSHSVSWFYGAALGYEYAEMIRLDLNYSEGETITYSVVLDIDADNTRWSKLGYSHDYACTSTTVTTTYFWYDGSGSHVEESNVSGPVCEPIHGEGYLDVFYQ